MPAVAAWPTLPPDQLPRDPWRHEHGDDPDHLLTADGHAPHHVEPFARMLGAPEQYVHHERRPVSPAATYLIGGEMLAFVVVALLVLAGSLGGAVA